jgi:hypothetical protein
MAKLQSIRIAAFGAFLFAVTACVFPFEVDIAQDGELPVVVEGDIIAGGMTVIALRHVQPLTGEKEEYGFEATGYIEGQDGTRIVGVQSGFDWITSSSDYSSELKLQFDTRNLSVDQAYRLHLEMCNWKTEATNTFESDWIPIIPAPVIDDITYSCHPEEEELRIGLSMHCNGAHFFRWNYREDWEYHAEIDATVTYDPDSGEIDPFHGPGLYRCWNTVESGRTNLFSTLHQTDDRFEKLDFHSINLRDIRLQTMYRIRVNLVALDKEAYDYWQNMQQISEGQGSILSPMPSEMASNIHCLTNPDLQVIGYLSGASLATADMYYDNSVNQFFIPTKSKYDERVEVPYSYWESLDRYLQGYLPYSAIYRMSNRPEAFMWALASCIDCRRLGGVTTRPSDWNPR